jgi:hypothetical protein
MHEYDARIIAQAMTNLSHAMTRLANAQTRLAAAAEDANKIARQHDTTN